MIQNYYMKYLNFSARKIFLFAKSFSCYTEFRRYGKSIYLRTIIESTTMSRIYYRDTYRREINLFNNKCVTRELLSLTDMRS